MDKIILKDGTELEFLESNYLNIVFNNKKIEELEKIFTSKNCQEIKFANSLGEIYGIYNDLECVDIKENIKELTTTVILKDLNYYTQKIGY